jgi:glutamyl-tRNA synthetase
MKRKGYQAGALRKFAVSMGVTQTDKTVSQEEFMKSLNYFNKELIDPIANRYYCIRNPVVITVRNAPLLELEQDLHPDNKKGGRKFKTNTEFFIEKDDYEQLQPGQFVRLMGCLNFKVLPKNIFEFDSKEYGVFRDNETKDKKQIHWLPQDQSQLTKITIKLDDNTDIKCFAEKSAGTVIENQMIQFERFGFCRCDAKQSFWFAHK